MNYSGFYELSTGFKRGCLQVSSEQIEDETPYVYGEAKVERPIVFKHYIGNKIYDLLETGWASLYLFSERIITAFEANNISGWKKYPAEVYDKKGLPIHGYSVFAVTGRAGPINDSLSEIIWKDPPVPEGNCYQVRKGMYFDLSSWDRSDIFILKKSLAIVVTQKVKSLLEEIKATNFNLKSVIDIESQIF